MKIDYTKIDSRVLREIVDFMTLNNKAKNTADAIQQISAGLYSDIELFTMYLNWNGIIGYEDQIVRAIDTIRSSKGD